MLYFMLTLVDILPFDSCVLPLQNIEVEVARSAQLSRSPVLFSEVY